LNIEFLKQNISLGLRRTTKMRSYPIIIVQFNDFIEKQKWIIYNKNIYINESLTAVNRKLFFEIRMFVKSSKHYKFEWCTGGKFFVKQDESGNF